VLFSCLKKSVFYAHFYGSFLYNSSIGNSEKEG
jgi:hypothetical protein